MNLNRKYSLSLSLSSLDGPHHSYLQQHRHPHTHRGRWFHPDQFLRLLWSLQREPVYDRNGESDIQFSNMKLNIALCVSSVFRRFVCSDDSGPCWSNRCHDPGENTRKDRKSDRNNQNIKRELINSANLSKTLCLNTSEEDNQPWRGLGMIFRSR